MLLPRLLASACPAKKAKKEKRLKEKKWRLKGLQIERGQTGVNIGITFQQQRQLRELQGRESEAVVAVFLLDNNVTFR